jgi:hypothetical protein
LIPGARVGDVRPMGEEGRHARFNLSTGTLSARGVAFNSNAVLEAAQREPHDLTVRLEVNHWNGGVEPRAVLSGAHGRGAPAAGGLDDEHACEAGSAADWWWERFDLEIGRELPAADAAPGPVAIGGERRRIDARRGSAVARIAELLSSGGRVMVVSADAARRGALLAAIGPDRYGAAGALACLRCRPGELIAAAADDDCRVLLTDWSSLSAAPDAACSFEHLVLVDPAPSAALEAIACGGSGAGFLHSAWAAGSDIAELCWGSEWDLRGALAEIYRGLAARELSGEELRAVLRGPGRYGRSPEAAARCVRILDELGIASGGGSGDARWLRVVSSERTALDRSGAWRAYSRIHEEGLTYLQSRRAERPTAQR